MVNDDVDMIAMVSGVCAMISEVNLVGTNHGGWWIDTGATRHMCADKSLFNSFRAVDNGQKLYTGNSATGEGDVVLKMTSEKELKLFQQGDVVLRQSYKPESYGKLYYACPKSKPPKHFGCGFFLWKETRLRELMSSPGAPSYSAGHSTPPSYSSGPSTPPSYSSGPSTPTNYSLGSSRNRECSNCKHLRGKISVLKATMEMHMHPEQHTVNSAALFHEVLNEMEKLDLE
ncbi:hypothetical protein Tco_0784274 [Tanacetum coccineum]